MNLYVAVALGGALGAVGRYAVSGYVMRAIDTGFPYGTLAVNVAGGLLMGLIVEFSALRWNVPPDLRAFLTVGALGGFTTFSAFSLEVALLIERHALADAAVYVVLSVALSVGALFAGLAIGRAMA